MMRSAFWVSILLAAVSAATFGSAGADTALGENGSLRSADGGSVRALIIGIDAYRHVKPLKGAVADARDIENALRRSGVEDITALIDAKADRATVLSSIDSLLSRVGPRDLVIFSLAGHGAQEPERVRGTQPDGVENVFLLPGFETSGTGSEQRILGAEFNHFLKQLEARGAHVVFIADTCFGGGMTRDIDPRSEEMSFRQVPAYRVSGDQLHPVATAADELLTEVDFERTTFLAAVDRKTKAPEVQIPGVPGFRGALSYAVARAIEGNAAINGDGKTTVKELFGNVRQVVYQLSNERQNIVTTAPAGTDPNTEVVFEIVRAASGEPLRLASDQAASASTSTVVPSDARPLKIASLDGNASHLSGIKGQQAPFKIVSPVDHPDLTWDPASRDVLAWGDVVAYGVELADLSSVIDRALAIRELKLMSANALQPIKVTPDDSLHRDSSLVHIEIPDVASRAMILLNIAGDGTVELLYPVGSDPYILRNPSYSFPVRVRKPYGSDQLIVVTSQQRMTSLEQAIQELDKRRAALQAVNILMRFAPADARIGSAGLFTAP